MHYGCQKKHTKVTQSMKLFYKGQTWVQSYDV